MWVGPRLDTPVIFQKRKGGGQVTVLEGGQRHPLAYMYLNSPQCKTLHHLHSYAQLCNSEQLWKGLLMVLLVGGGRHSGPEKLRFFSGVWEGRLSQWSTFLTTCKLFQLIQSAKQLQGFGLWCKVSSPSVNWLIQREQLKCPGHSLLNWGKGNQE